MISEELHAEIKKWKEGHSEYKDYDLDQVFESFINIGFYAYLRDGAPSGSIHLRKGGDFDIND
jgi:hypothetical protein